MVDFPTIFGSILSPINVVFFVLGVFSVLVVQMLPILGNEKITLNTRDVYAARFGHWAGIIAILLVVYIAAGPSGWYEENMQTFTKKTIMLSPEWVSEVTAYNLPQTAMKCVYGACVNRTIVCTNFGCRYASPKNASDVPNGSLIFPNFTTFEYNGTWVIIKNQSLPRKAEIR